MCKSLGRDGRECSKEKNKLDLLLKLLVTKIYIRRLRDDGRGGKEYGKKRRMS